MQAFSWSYVMKYTLDNIEGGARGVMVIVVGNERGDSSFGLVSLFNGISTLFRLFNAKAILLEEQWWYYLTHSWEDKGVHTFPKSICPKVNVIAWLEYELEYYDSAVHRFNHYITRTPPRVQILDETDCISYSTNTLGKGRNPIILPPAMGK